MKKTMTRQQIKELSLQFHIPETTLATWATAEKRKAHRELLLSAMDALHNQPDQYSFVMQQALVPFDEIGAFLGLDKPLRINIPGVPARTFQGWAETPEKRMGVIGFLLGYHWQLLTVAANQANRGSTLALAEWLHKKNVSPGQFVRLCRVEPDVMIKLCKL